MILSFENCEEIVMALFPNDSLEKRKKLESAKQTIMTVILYKGLIFGFEKKPHHRGRDFTFAS